MPRREKALLKGESKISFEFAIIGHRSRSDQFLDVFAEGRVPLSSHCLPLLYFPLPFLDFPPFFHRAAT